MEEGFELGLAISRCVALALECRLSDEQMAACLRLSPNRWLDIRAEPCSECMGKDAEERLRRFIDLIEVTSRMMPFSSPADWLRAPDPKQKDATALGFILDEEHGLRALRDAAVLSYGASGGRR